MENTIYLSHYQTIKSLVNKLGTDEADNYLRDELSNFSKKVAIAREKIHNIIESIELQSNSDEKIHLEYELQDAKDILSILLKKLKTADDKYLCYKEYITNYKGGFRY